MQGTLKMFRTLNDNSLNKYSLEELSSIYKSNKSPQIIANAFIRLYDLINRCGAKFYYLDESDLSSISVQCINESLLHYENKEDIAAFTSYFYSVLYKSFLTEHYQRSCHKRKINYDIHIKVTEDLYSSDEDNIEDNSIKSYDLISIKNMEDDILTNMVIEDSPILNKKEKQLCKYIISGYDNYSKVELSELMNVTRPTVYNILKSLKNKFNLVFPT